MSNCVLLLLVFLLCTVVISLLPFISILNIMALTEPVNILEVCGHAFQ